MQQQRTLTAAMLLPEIKLTASRSSGPGGQNVNKVNSKITLTFHVAQAMLLTEAERALLLQKLHKQLTADGVLVLVAQESRSQLENRDAVLKKFDSLIRKAFVKPKVRKPTKPTKRSVQTRITGKKKQAEKKQWRKKPE